ncbi:MAG: helix-turn-helix transcriptional regulator [Deltaproteobacteria bacterium]|nr:helix-turn-helix transcriptional regulator [Deltaproteobacteria bacterium]
MSAKPPDQNDQDDQDDQDEHREKLAENLRQNVKYVRERRNMTQAQLAKKSGVPRSTVANLETGAANPTLSVLHRVATALGLSVEELLSPPRGRLEVFRAGELPTVTRARGAARVDKLLPHPIPGMEIDRIRLEPGAHMPGVPHRAGTSEYLACDEGRLTLWTNGERIDLEAGDVAAFAGDQPHSYHNEGDVPATGFSVVTLRPGR